MSWGGALEMATVDLTAFLMLHVGWEDSRVSWYLRALVLLQDGW